MAVVRGRYGGDREGGMGLPWEGGMEGGPGLGGGLEVAWRVTSRGGMKVGMACQIRPSQCRPFLPTKNSRVSDAEEADLTGW